jgi:hypothetical protein
VHLGSLYSSRLVLRNTNTQGSTKERLTSTSSVAILSMYGSTFNGSSCVFAHGQRRVLLNHVTCITNVYDPPISIGNYWTICIVYIVEFVTPFLQGQVPSFPSTIKNINGLAELGRTHVAHSQQFVTKL